MFLCSQDRYCVINLDNVSVIKLSLGIGLVFYFNSSENDSMTLRYADNNEAMSAIASISAGYSAGISLLHL